MKKLLFVAMIISLIAVAVGMFLRIGISELPYLERQTFVILLTAKQVLLVALYIAWRVTPESKPPLPARP